VQGDDEDSGKMFLMFLILLVLEIRMSFLLEMEKPWMMFIDQFLKSD